MQNQIGIQTTNTTYKKPAPATLDTHLLQVVRLVLPERRAHVVVAMVALARRRIRSKGSSPEALKPLQTAWNEPLR